MTTLARASLAASDGGGFRTVNVELDDPGPDEVLVEVRASGLCASDLHATANLAPGHLGVAGHEFSGVVARTGTAVGDLAVGDHIVGCLVRYCGSCVECRRGEPRLCLYPDSTLRPPDAPPRIRYRGERVEQLWGLGGFSSHAVVHRRQLHLITSDLPFDRSFLLGCGILTGVGTVLNVARPTADTSVAVFGAGGIGLSAIQGARIAGATTIIAVDIHEAKLDLARTMGATHVVDGSREDASARIRSLTGGLGVHIAIEAAGVLTSARSALEATRNGGHVVLVGLQRPDATLDLSPLSDLILSQRSITGVSMGASDPRRDIPAYAAMAEAGRLDLGALVSAQIGLDDITDAYEALRGGTIVRSVVTRF